MSYAKKALKIVIESQYSNLKSNLIALWKYRTFLFYLAIYALQKRYKETILGWLWLIIRPLAPVLLFTIIFGNISNFKSETGKLPYFLFILTGMCLWNFLSSSLIFITKSFYMYKKIINNFHFPKILAPVGSVSISAVELLLNLILLTITNLYFYFIQGELYIKPSLKLLVSILFIFLTFILVLGIGFWTSILNARARDVRFTLPFVLQIWFYGTPIVYPVSLIPSQWKTLIYYLNPMTEIVEGFKWSVLGIGGLNPIRLTICSTIVYLIFLSGLWFISKAELAYNKDVDFSDDIDE